MTVLLVSPDYASHYLPLSAIGQELRARGVDVVVATGPAMQRRVLADGFEHRLLRLGPGSNGGLIRPEDQAPEEAKLLAAFFAATRRGPIDTLWHQAEHRLRDLLWEPEQVTARLAEIVDEIDPRIVLSDQLAYGASLALRALERPYASLLPGHPTALPGPGELFGLPPYLPAELGVDPVALGSLATLCEEVSRRFAAEFTTALGRLNPRATAPPDPFAACSPWLTLLSYPAELARHRPLQVQARYIGGCARDEPADPLLEAEIAALPGPRIYVSLGSFLSSRTDVLERIASAFRDEPVSLVVAAGVSDLERLELADGRHVVRRYLPQTRALTLCDLVVCHGGNNTVTEALHAGVPLLVGPFSSDQFAGAEDVRRGGVGDCFDPNRAAPIEIARKARSLLEGTAHVRAAELGLSLRETPGRVLAADHLLALERRTGISRIATNASGGRRARGTRELSG